MVNLVLYWGKDHQALWYLATLLGDDKLAVDKYRQQMGPEQYFRGGKQYFVFESCYGNGCGAAVAAVSGYSQHKLA